MAGGANSRMIHLKEQKERKEAAEQPGRSPPVWARSSTASRRGL